MAGLTPPERPEKSPDSMVSVGRKGSGSDLALPFLKQVTCSLSVAPVKEGGVSTLFPLSYIGKKLMHRKMLRAK